MQLLFEKAWSCFLEVTPKMGELRNLLVKRFGPFENDHIALRTIDSMAWNLDRVAVYLERRGFKKRGEYFFETKKLRAYHFEIDGMPKIFVSELLTDNFSAFTQNVFKDLASKKSCAKDFLQFFDLPRNWTPSVDIRNKLLEESEYAGWFYTFGLVPNHFTLAVNSIESAKSLAGVVEFLKSSNIALNESGRPIKGTESLGLIQASTKAFDSKVKFVEREEVVPGCYYEFAQRFKINGELFNGFIESSADKIFESTNSRV